MEFKPTLSHLYDWRATQTPQGVYGYTPDKTGQYAPVTFQQMTQTSNELLAGLYALGIRRGERVVVLSNTRYEWGVLDTAILRMGAVMVGVYPTSTAEQVAYIVAHCEAKVVVVEDASQYDKIMAHASEFPALKAIVLIDKAKIPAGITLTWEELLAKGRAVLNDQPGLPQQVRDEVEPDDIATLVYTSGTTGPPKGVVLRHRNLLAIAKTACEFMGLIPNQETTLAYLPLAHILQRVNMYGAAYHGLTTYFVSDITKLRDVCQIAQPTILAAVPRVYEKVHAGIMANIAKAPPSRQKMFERALEVGLHRSRCLQAGQPIPFLIKLQYAVFDKLLFSKIRGNIFGHRIRFLNSGAAPISIELLEFFHAIGLAIFEGYGLTETSSPITLNITNGYRFGTVGRPLPGSEVKIAADGEILLKGPGVFTEYYKNPEATREAIDPEGWFHSGDIGAFDEAGFLRITDRKKNLIITSGGKNIAPANIENLIMGSDPYISQAMVYGDRQKYLVALITLDEMALKQWAAGHGKGHLSFAQLTQDAEVVAMVQKTINKANQALAQYETVKYFRILPEEVTVENGMLTPTLKLKRREVVAKYEGLIQEMYRES